MPAQGLADLIAAYQALEHIACHGWAKGVDSDGRPMKSKSRGDGITHDPKAVSRLGQLKIELYDATKTALDGEKPTVTIKAPNEFLTDAVSAFNVLSGDQDRVDRYDKRLGIMAYSVNCWLDDRDVEVNGCQPPKDCTRHDLDLGRSRACGHLNATGNCKIRDRKNIGRK